MTPDQFAALLDAAWLGDRATLRAGLAALSAALPPEHVQRWQDRLAEAEQPTRGPALGRYRYGTQEATAYAADGVQGLALGSAMSAAPRALFRVKDPDAPGGIRDYIWRHCDLGLRIEDGYEAAFYHLADGTCRLDHAPETLGLVKLP